MRDMLQSNKIIILKTYFIFSLFFFFVIRAEEERSSRLREESITLREELNKIYLCRDLLEQQRLETESLLNIVEKQKAELEYDLDKINVEKQEAKEMLEKSATSHETLAQDVKLMKSCITEV